MTALYITSL